MPQSYLPVLISLAVAFALGGILLLLSWVSGKRVGGRIKLSTYESGLPLLDRSRKRFSIAFFLIAIDFVVFDVEAAFLYPWSLVVRIGAWTVFWAVMVFTGFIVAGYAYVWRKGGLELATRLPSRTVETPR